MNLPARQSFTKEENLKRIEKIIDVSDEEKKQMQDHWTLIGYDTSEQLAVIPRQHYVIVNKRARYAGTLKADWAIPADVNLKYNQTVWLIIGAGYRYPEYMLVFIISGFKDSKSKVSLVESSELVI
jgi:hypothetical protein